MNNQIENKGRDQNIAQGDGAIAKQVNNYGVPFEAYGELAGKYAVTEAALASFFKILEEQHVPPGDLDSKLRDIAGQYKELITRLEIVQSADPQVQRLKDEAKKAVEVGDYAEAEDLLNQAEVRDIQAIEELEQAARQRRVSAAASCAANAKLQEMQYRYAKAAEHWQKAAALLPEEEKKDRAYYLNMAGYSLEHIAKYSEALPLFEQSLVISKEIGNREGECAPLNNIGRIYNERGDNDQALKYMEQSLVISKEIGNREGEGVTLGNIGGIYEAWGDYDQALKYYEQSLAIRQEIGDKAGEGVTLNNIAGIHSAQGDYATALKYYEQSLLLFREIGDREYEGGTLNNISQIYHDRGDYDQALKYLEQSLVISKEIGDRAGEAVIIYHIGRTYNKQGDLTKAEQYINRAVQLMDEIGHPKREEYRMQLDLVRLSKAAEVLRAKIKRRQGHGGQ